MKTISDKVGVLEELHIHLQIAEGNLNHYIDNGIPDALLTRIRLAVTRLKEAMRFIEENG